MIRINSLDDPRIADYRHLADHQWLRAAGLFVAEGRRVVRRLIGHPRFRVRSVLVTEPAFAALDDVLAATSADVFVIEQREMNEVAGFNIHRGCLALAERPEPRLLRDFPIEILRRVVILEKVNNPDNVGGIFRSAAAFGVAAVVLGPACSDPLYRKSIRTSMAATLAVPFVDAGDWPGAIRVLHRHGLAVFALTPSPDAVPLADISPDVGRVAILVGAEGEGLTRDAIQAADMRVRIPMSGPADSLNVTVAASIALYHFSVTPTAGA